MGAQLKRTLAYRIWRRIFGKPFRGYLLENKYKIDPAFELGGVKYFMFANQEEAPTGRQMAALAIYNEMEMRCTREYLELHCKAMDKILSDPKKLNISYIVQINSNLKERLDLMLVPEFIYKLASVIFFDETESPYTYDYEYNKRKQARWKKDEAMLAFFLRTPLSTLVPFLKTQEGVSSIYFKMADQIAAIHQQQITAILSPVASTTG